MMQLCDLSTRERNDERPRIFDIMQSYQVLSREQTHSLNPEYSQPDGVECFEKFINFYLH